MNGVQGNQAAQVRMFAHDAREVQLVKNNTSTGAGAMNSCVMTTNGSGYTAGWSYGVATSGGSGSGLTVDISVVNGEVVEAIVNDYGSALYQEDEELTITGGGGSGAKFKCFKALPRTSQRGACLYAGVKIASITVKMESGKTAIFKGVQSGSFMPVLVTEVTSVTVDSGNVSDNDLIALY